MKYKLTNQHMQTHNNFQWEIGKWCEIDKPDRDAELCTNKWFHFYHHPLLAALLNPIHANINNPRLFEIETGGLSKDDNGLKGGCTKMMLVREIPLPKVTIKQRVTFGILCSLEVCQEKDFVQWANNWIAGERTCTAAATADADAAAVAAYATAADAAADVAVAYVAAADAAADVAAADVAVAYVAAADAAADVAAADVAAADASYDAVVAAAADVAAAAASYDAVVAAYAYDAADAAADAATATKIDLIALAEKAVNLKTT